MHVEHMIELSYGTPVCGPPFYVVPRVYFGKLA